MIKPLSLLSGLCAAVLLAPATAQAGLTICNETAVSQSLAIGFKDGDAWVSEGWWSVESGSCTTPIGGDLKNRYYYYRATAKGREFRGENIMFCTTSKAFTIRGDENCVSRGYDNSEFRKIDTGKTAKDFTLTLVDDSAQAAPPPAPPKLATPTPFAPGTYGEPFTQITHLQGCDAFDGSEMCMLYADGWRYIALYAGATSPLLIHQLESLPLNTRVAISGDIVTYGDVSAEVILSSVEPLTPGPYAQLRQAVQGEWVAADDPASTLFIHGAEQHGYYDGVYGGTMILDFTESCFGAGGAGPALTARSMENWEEDEYCYTILSLGNGVMEIAYAGNGNSLRYFRR